jgi:oxygen-independent coproporphyrinogen III oxidase
MSEIGLYVHVPFCRGRCAYCDFATTVGLDGLRPRYVAAVCREVRSLPQGLDLATVYFGGGTPSLLSAAEIAAVLDAAGQRGTLVPGAEVTLEANPGDLDEAALARLRSAGINRLSIGVQSFDDRQLRSIGRRHDAARALSSLELARAAGFSNVSIDLIFGLPFQSADGWRENLDLALSLAPEHLSLYCLTLEAGTPLASAVERGEVTVPDDDLAADMYEEAREHLGAAYDHYEISNWARRDCARDLRARHNLRYWEQLPYVGVGAAAHSCFGAQRYHNVDDPREYVARVEAGADPCDAADSEDVTPALDEADSLILGLRLSRGVSRESYKQRFGTDLAERHAATIARLASYGLVELDSDCLRLTPRGQLLGNEVFQSFLP